MAKSNRNNGKFQQDGIMGGFNRDSKYRPTGSSAVEMCMKDSDKRQAYIEKKRLEADNQPRMSMNFFLSTSK